MSKKFLKLFALTAAVVMAAGAAWALTALPTVVPDATTTVTGGAENNADYLLDNSNQTASPFAAWAPAYYTFNGDGSFTGALYQGTPATLPLALYLQAGANSTLVIAPRAQTDVARGVYNLLPRYDAAFGGEAFSLVATSDGRVNIFGGQGNSPSDAVDTGPDGVKYYENTYAGGLYVEKGTVALGHGNAAGYGPVFVAAGSTLAVEGTQNVSLGNQSPSRYPLSSQPVVLGYYVRNPLATLTYQAADAVYAGFYATPTLFNPTVKVGEGRVVSATLDASDVAGNQQTMDLYSGIRQAAYYQGLASSAGMKVLASGAPNAGALVVTDSANMVGNYWTNDPAVDTYGNKVTGTVKSLSSAAEMAAFADGDFTAVQLVKTGAGLLHSSAPDTEQQLAVWNNTYRGGTAVAAGTFFADGKTAGEDLHKFKGSVGDTWRKGEMNAANGYVKSYPDTTLTARDNYNLVDGSPRNNSLSLGVDDTTYASLVVNRDQFFSSFEGKAGTLFTAWKYAVKDKGNNLPQITVWLNGGDSVFDGKIGGQALTGAFRPTEMSLVLESRHPGNEEGTTATRFPFQNFPARTNGVRNPAQAFLHLNNPNNEAIGNTLIVNGVLAAMGANSIPYAGTEEGQLLKDGRLVIATDKFLGEDDRGFGTYPLNKPEIIGEVPDHMVDPDIIAAGGDGQWYNANVLTTTADDPYFLENDRAVYLLKGAGEVLIPNPTTVNDYGSLAAQAGTTARYANITLNGVNDTLRTPTQPMNFTREWNISNYNYAGSTNVVINPRAVIESPTVTGTVSNYSPTVDVYPDMTNVEAPIVWRDNFTYPVWTGTVMLGEGDNTYTFGGNSRSPSNITISRGTLHLGGYPTGTDAFANLMIRSSARLSLGENVNNFAARMNVTFDDDSRLRVVVRQSDLRSAGDDVYQADAIAEFHLVEFGPLGTGDANKDRRVVIELDGQASGLGTIPAGSWIKVMGATTGNNWNNTHYSGTGTDRDYWKIRVARPGFADQPLDESQVKVHLNETTYEIILEVLADIAPTPDPETQTDATMLTAASTNPTSAQPGETVTLYFNVGDNYIPGELVAMGLPSGWTGSEVTGNADGYDYMITGPMPASGNVSAYVVGMNQSDLREYRSSTITVTGTTPAEDKFVGTMTAAPTEVRAGENVTFTLTGWTFTPAGGTAVQLDWDDENVDITNVALTNGTFVDTEDDDFVGDNQIVVQADSGLATGSRVTLTATATYSNTTGTATASAAITERKSGGSSSSGCDAGFAGLALLLAAPLFLRKKD